MKKLVTSAAFIGAGLVGPVVLAAPAAGDPPDVTHVVSHEDETFYIPAAPECGAPFGATEIQEGTERLHIVESGEDIHFAAGETIWVTVISDDPTAAPTDPRQVTDAVVFHSINEGAVQIFHESFHDNGTVWGDIAVHETFVEVNGTVRVERFSGRNLPPEGC